MKASKRVKPKQIPLLLVEDETRRLNWFTERLPRSFRIVHARSAGVALGIIERDGGYVYGGMMLDHDLQSQTLVPSDRGLSGSHIIEAIYSKISRDVPVLVHSMNPEKSPVMVRRLEEAGFYVQKVPWEFMNKQFFHEWLDEVEELWEDDLDMEG